MTAPEVTRGEFEMLRQQVGDNARRLDSIDASGTRGVGIVQVQLTDLAKDVAALRAQLHEDVAGLEKRLDDHDTYHREQERQGIVSRRWIITTWIAVLVAVEGPLLYLVAQQH